MAKINKLQKSGVTIYPATIPQAVIDSETGKTQKEVNDDVVEVAKTLKQVEDNASVKIENLIVNGDFRNGTSGWASESGGGISVLNNTLSVTGNGSNAGPTAIQKGVHLSFKAGEKIYVGASFKVLNSDATSIYVDLRTSSLLSFSIQSPLANNEYKVKTIFTSGGEFGETSYVRIRTTYADAATAAGKVTEIKAVKVINLTTTFGEGNEPTEEEMDLLISTLGIDYFEGEITIPAQKIMQWQLALIRRNKNAIIALGGTII